MAAMLDGCAAQIVSITSAGRLVGANAEAPEISYTTRWRLGYIDITFSCLPGLLHRHVERMGFRWMLSLRTAYILGVLTIGLP